MKLSRCRQIKIYLSFVIRCSSMIVPRIKLQRYTYAIYNNNRRNFSKILGDICFFFFRFHSTVLEFYTDDKFKLIFFYVDFSFKYP